MSERLSSTEKTQAEAAHDSEYGTMPTLEIAQKGSCANNCEGCRCKALSDKSRD